MTWKRNRKQRRISNPRCPDNFQNGVSKSIQNRKKNDSGSPHVLPNVPTLALGAKMVPRAPKWTHQASKIRRPLQSVERVRIPWNPSSSSSSQPAASSQPASQPAQPPDPINREIDEPMIAASWNRVKLSIGATGCLLGGWSIHDTRSTKNQQIYGNL